MATKSEHNVFLCPQLLFPKKLVAFYSQNYHYKNVFSSFFSGYSFAKKSNQNFPVLTLTFLPLPK
jgi:hypothetical protein